MRIGRIFAYLGRDGEVLEDKNMIVWHLPNRNQGFAAKYKFFSKHDIAMVGASPDKDIPFNLEPEVDGLEEEYETALVCNIWQTNLEGYKR